VRDEHEIDPLDVTDDCAPHARIIAEYGEAMSRAVLWDFDETLAHRDGKWVGCLLEVLDEHEPGHAHCADDLRPSLRDGFPWHTPERAHPELAGADAWWAPVEILLAGAYGSVGYGSERAGELARHARSRYGEVGWAVYDDTIPTLERLREAGWRHVILSNHVPELRVIVERLGLAALIDAVVNSAETGYEKPHPEAFAIARRAAGDPEHLWMVGDNPVADVEGARAAGIPALLVRGTEGSTLAAAGDVISRTPGDAR
jgi:putative hydrolase of the HAD superfamily